MAAKLFTFLFDIPQLFLFFSKTCVFSQKKSQGQVVFLPFFCWGGWGGEGGPFQFDFADSPMGMDSTQLHNFHTISILKVRVKKRDPKNIPSLKLTYP